MLTVIIHNCIFNVCGGIILVFFKIQHYFTKCLISSCPDMTKLENKHFDEFDIHK